jgi:hypothetical protein
VNLPLTEPRPRKLELEFNFEHQHNETINFSNQDRESTDLIGFKPELKMFSDIYSIDSKFKLPNNYTPARFSNNILDSNNPLISGGDPKNSDYNQTFIGKRENPFESDLYSINNESGLKKEKKQLLFFEYKNQKSSSFDNQNSDFMIHNNAKDETMTQKFLDESSECSKANITSSLSEKL